MAFLPFLLRELYNHYPRFVVEEDLINCILSSGDLNQYLEGTRPWLLLKFIRDQPLLEVGGLLLPFLMEFYQWLHTDIAYLLTREQASSTTIGRLIEIAESFFGISFDGPEINFTIFADVTIFRK